MSDVTSVDHEGRLRGERLHLADCFAQGIDGRDLGFLVEADMAVGNLQEREVLLRSLRRLGLSEEVQGPGDTPRHCPKDSCARPNHALKSVAAAEPACVI